MHFISFCTIFQIKWNWTPRGGTSHNEKLEHVCKRKFSKWKFTNFNNVYFELIDVFMNNILYFNPSCSKDSMNPSNEFVCHMQPCHKSTLLDNPKSNDEWMIICIEILLKICISFVDHDPTLHCAHAFEGYRWAMPPNPHTPCQHWLPLIPSPITN